MQSASEAYNDFAQYRQRRSPLCTPAVALPRRLGGETELRAFFQHLIELNAQTGSNRRDRRKETR